MNELYVTAIHIKEILYPEHISMNATYKLNAEYHKRYKKAGLISNNTRKLPRDWFLEQLQMDQGFSDEAIELIKVKLKDIDLDIKKARFKK